jgi:hypothetical protein
VPGDAPWVAVLRTFRFVLGLSQIQRLSRVIAQARADTFLFANRIMRLFKIVKGMKELRILMYTIISALPGVSNIGVLLFLLMFMYACLGVTLYGDVDAPYGFPDGLNKHANFKTWPNAMFTLFVVFTGNWESIFRATYWNCAGDALDWGRECTHRYSAPFYFFSYYIFANCVLGNLFVSIILDKVRPCAFPKSRASLFYLERACDFVHTSRRTHTTLTPFLFYTQVHRRDNRRLRRRHGFSGSGTDSAHAFRVPEHDDTENPDLPDAHGTAAS